METILTNRFTWLSRHVPTFTFLICIVIGIVWVALKIDDFGGRVRDTERLCDDMNTRQLPQIRAEIKEVNERISTVDLRLSVIETQLGEIIKRLDAQKEPKPK